MEKPSKRHLKRSEKDSLLTEMPDDEFKIKNDEMDIFAVGLYGGHMGESSRELRDKFVAEKG